MIGFGSKDKRKKEVAPSLPHHEQRADPGIGVGTTIFFIGELRGKEDLFIDGQVNGSIGLDNFTLTIGPNGKIEADIQAKNVNVKGRVKGNIKAQEKVFIHETATVFGDITAANISVMDGAQFEGNARIQKGAQATQPEPTSTEKRSDSRLLIEDEFFEG
jgi:cytoskeletal protein CcmA (bactofilin family)